MKFVGILFVAILGVLGLDVEGMQASVLDFDGIFAPDQQIPEAFQPEWNDPSVEGNDATNAPISRYIFFPIKDSSDEVKFEPLGQWPNIFRRPRKEKNQGWYGSLSREQRQYKKAKNGEYNIYFLADGTQPTTEEAVEYSCANVDNRKDSPITRWYMKMFGVIDKNGGNSDGDDNYVKAGGDNVTTSSCRIISFDASVDGTLVDDPDIPNTQIPRRALFEREFCKIASNPVGRTLLYRLLIEIRRKDRNNYGVCGEDVLFNEKKFLTSRNNCKNVLISMGKESGYTHCPCVITLCNQRQQRGTISCRCSNGTIEIVRSNTSIDCDLFHEMLHWFHCLRDYKRYCIDTSRYCIKNFSKIESPSIVWRNVKYNPKFV